MIISNRFEAVDIPEVSLTAHVLERAESYGDKPALIDGPTGRTISYAQLVERVRSVGAGLHAIGFGKGDVCGIFCPNLPEYAVLFHAVSTIGGTCTTVNPLYTEKELGKQLADAGARLLVTVPPFIGKALAAAKEVGIERVYVIGEAEGATPFSQLHADPADCPVVEIDPRHDVVVLPYSSGTTGFPKGVKISHRNLVANIEQLAACDTVTEKDVLIGFLPCAG